MKSMKKLVAGLLTCALAYAPQSLACTGITLNSTDGNIIVARTVEWALSDAQHNKILIAPRNKVFKGLTPEGSNGHKWTGKYGFVSITAYDQPYGPDGLNEEGLYVGVYYLPGFAEYAEYSKKDASTSMSVGDFMQWMLSSFKTVDGILKNINKIKVVSVKNKDFGGAELPFHFKIADAKGNSKIIEIIEKGKIKIYEPYLGVITNSPTYDWHILNQRNYLGLSTMPKDSKKFDNYQVSPTGGGSGFLGLPGDFTPPSRFVRAAAFTATARPLKNAEDAVFESFRILDNFNVPIGAQLPKSRIPEGVASATQVTTSSDLKNKVFYYHTMWNRQIRKIDLKKIDFAKVKEQIIDDDKSRKNTLKELNVKG
jgi:choloylglycine hydrolase